MNAFIRSRGARLLSVIIPAAVISLSLTLYTAGAAAQEAADTSASAADSSFAEKEAEPSLKAKIVLEKGGVILIELFPEDAPITVERFVELVRNGFYDDLEFHRVENFVVQTGNRDNDYPPIIGEMFGQDLRHKVGSVGMARKPDSYDSATTQFYMVKECRSALQNEYTVFGEVIEGMDLVHKIKKRDKIKSIEIIE
ncbi:MAG: peptidylprolyl isomerase [Candidatus Krumholzibacteriota bacterium]|nr:peptidylprolyl isomerase [Candidatus Krumholzibacteriota bacterium]